MEETKVHDMTGSRGAQWTTAGTLIGLLVSSLMNGAGGLFGARGCGNPNGELAFASMIAQKDAEIAGLKAEKYSDNNDVATYKAALADNAKLRDEVFAFVNPIASTVAELKT